tara:strand:- start:375 stop:596 length:222 start_codon:yes stop_codon:yes gene_type:complete
MKKKKIEWCSQEDEETSADLGSLSTYSTNLEKDGEFVEMTICNEMETWSDEFNNMWNVPITIERHFEDATPIN